MGITGVSSRYRTVLPHWISPSMGITAFFSWFPGFLIHILVSAMKLFVYEHITGGGLAETPLPSSLADEGKAMLRAVLADLAGVVGVSLVATVDARLERSLSPGLEGRVELVAAGTRVESREQFDRLAAHSDGCLIIAPETDGALLERTLRARELGARVLGSSAAAIRMASDKLEVAHRLAAHGIPCLRAVSYRRDVPPPFPPPWVLKPRAGAGSTDSYLLADLADQIDLKDAILTPYIAGVAASVLVIVGEREVFPLAPAEQRLSEDDRPRYLGGIVPFPFEARSSDAEARAIRLARRAIDAVSGLAGFVGVDLILGRESGPDSVDTVVEINPRLTTSYVGLRALARENLAERGLEAMLGQPVGPIGWREGEVRFSASGEVHEGARA